MATDSYRTRVGGVVPAVTAAQMGEIDRIAMDERGPNLFQMMENAGRSVAMAVIERLGTHAKRVVVVAGTGGNGGGGICAARHLANHGVDVTLVLSDPDGLTEVTAEQLRIYGSTPGGLRSRDDLDGFGAHIGVDALIGYRLVGEPRDDIVPLIDFLNDRCEQVVSVDVPSGVDATTGEHAGAHVHATVTVTLALPKTGLDVAAVGRLELADIGITRGVYEDAGVSMPPSMFGLGYRVRILPA